MSLYVELGSHDIMVSPNTSHNPIIDQLKYLLHRNKGMLAIRQLIGREDDSEQLCQALLKALMDLIRATLYKEPDVKLIQVLSTLFTQLGLLKLARLVLEFKLGNVCLTDSKDTELVWDLNSPLEILPDQINLMDDYMKFIDSLGDSSSHLYEYIRQRVNSPMFWDSVTSNEDQIAKLGSIISPGDFFKCRTASRFVNLVIDVTVHANIASVDDVFNNLLESMPKHKGRRRFFDGYILTNRPVDSVKFEFNVNNDDYLPIPDAADSNDEEDEVVTPAETTPLADTPDYDTAQEEVTIPAPEQSGLSKLSTQDSNAVPEINDTVEKLDNEPSNETQEIVHPQPVSEVTQLSGQIPDPAKTSTPRVRNTRNKPDVVKRPLNAEMFVHHDTFLADTMLDFTRKSKVDIILDPWSPYILGDLQGEDINSILIESFLDWKPVHTESLATPVSTTITKKDVENNNGEEFVKEILTYNGTDRTVKKCATFSEIDQGQLYQLLQTLNSGTPHLYQIRIAVLTHIFTLDSTNYGTLLTNGKLKRRTVTNIKSVLDSVEINMLKSFEKYVSTRKENADFIQKLNVAISICEVLIDSYLECMQSHKAKGNNKNRSRVTELEHTEKSLLTRINKWLDLIEELFNQSAESNALRHLRGRFNWSKILYLQNADENINISYLLDELEVVIETFKVESEGNSMVNFENILPINNHEVNIQLSKLKIMDKFSKKGNANDMLQRIFMDITDTPIDNEQKILDEEVKKIINASSFDLKFKLWVSLLKQYVAVKSFDKAQAGFESVIKIIQAILSPASFDQNKKDEKMFVLFKCLGYFGNFCDLMVQNIFDNELMLCDRNQESFQETFKTLLYFFHLLYGYLIYQDSTVLTNGRKNMASNSQRSLHIFNNAIVNASIILSLYFEKSLQVKTNEDINNFLSVMHGELGYRNICDYSNGRFLKYMQHRLVQLDWDGSANDIFQILNCRFGFQVTNGDDFEPFDHKCKPKKMEEEDALDLSQFIVSYCHKKKHPIISPPRSDVKTMLDSIIELVSSHSQTDSIIQKNESTVRKYLNQTELNLAFVLDVFQGKVSLPLELSQNVKFSVVKNGVYYLQASIALHTYKIRRRNMQSRAAELDYVIKMLETDLISGVERFETWILLGQSFGYLVEDDLIWTADKMNSVEKRKYTAFIQKKALTCYFMAINIYIRMDEQQKEKNKPIIEVMWSSFAIELYNSWFAPLNTLSFHVTPTQSSLETISNGFEMTASELTMDTLSNDIPQRVLIKILEIAFVSGGNTWFNSMYVAKTKLKMDGQALEVSSIMDSLLSSCNIASNASNKDDPIIEPHYQLFTSVFKLYERDLIDYAAFVGYLKSNSLFAPIFENATPKSDAYELSEKILTKIAAYDKKNWQHRPIFRLAKLYETHYSDYERSVSQMGNIVNLKPTVRNLTTIWKPDHERPGRHFYYCGEYSKFISDLVFKQRDICVLTTIVKKLRKLGSSMTSPSKVYDYATNRLCVLIKAMNNITPGLLDIAVNKVRPTEIAEHAKNLLEYMKDKEVEELSKAHQMILFFIGEMLVIRKLTQGYATITLVEDVLYSLYMVLYFSHIYDNLVSHADSSFITIIEDKLYLNDIPNTTHNADGDGSNISVTNDADGSGVSVSVVNAANSEANTRLAKELSSELQIEDKIRIFRYVTPVKMSNLTKEKRIAKRDIGPYAQELLLAMGKQMEVINEKFSNPEELKYRGPELSEEYVEKLMGKLTPRATKEVKEDADLQILAQSHDISLKEEDLESINSILNSFGIGTLENHATKHEQKMEREKELKREEELRQAELDAQKKAQVAIELEKQAETVKAFILTQQREMASHEHSTDMNLPLTGTSLVGAPDVSTPPISLDVAQTPLTEEYSGAVKLPGESNVPAPLEIEESQHAVEKVVSIEEQDQPSVEDAKPSGREPKLHQSTLPFQTRPVVRTKLEVPSLDAGETKEPPIELTSSPTALREDTLKVEAKQFKGAVKLTMPKRLGKRGAEPTPPVVAEPSVKRRRRGRGAEEEPMTMLGDKGKPIDLIFTSKEQKQQEQVQVLGSSRSSSPQNDTIIEIE